jgi:hypothetical protein
MEILVGFGFQIQPLILDAIHGHQQWAVAPVETRNMKSKAEVSGN